MVPYAQDAVLLMAANVRTERINRRWTTEELASRSGCSRYTIAAIEHGKPTVAFGHVLNVCAALNIPLYLPDREELARLTRSQREIVRLMPNRVMPKVEPSNDF
jgi:transcriptional regulator with XRE-family HTH domain